MNWSVTTADRATHLKIVVVALIAAIGISVAALSSRHLDLGTDVMTAQAPVIKATRTVMWSASETPNIR